MEWQIPNVIINRFLPKDNREAKEHDQVFREHHGKHSLQLDVDNSLSRKNHQGRNA